MLFQPNGGPDHAPGISMAHLKHWLDQGEPVVLLDVRRHPDDQQIPNSIRVEPTHFLETFNPVVAATKDQIIVAYCA